MNARDQRIWDSAFAAAYVAEFGESCSRIGTRDAMKNGEYFAEIAERVANHCLENFRLMNAARVKK